MIIIIMNRLVCRIKAGFGLARSHCHKRVSKGVWSCDYMELRRFAVEETTEENKVCQKIIGMNMKIGENKLLCKNILKGELPNLSLFLEWAATVQRKTGKQVISSQIYQTMLDNVLSYPIQYYLRMGEHGHDKLP